jgi:hypothetical protein
VAFGGNLVATNPVFLPGDDMVYSLGDRRTMEVLSSLSSWRCRFVGLSLPLPSSCYSVGDVRVLSVVSFCRTRSSAAFQLLFSR